MYYPDLQSSFPGVNWSQLDRLYIPADHYRFLNLGNLPQRSAAHPLVITNLGGQVRVGGLGFHYNFSIGGGSHWKLTGRWDAAAATGNDAFPGHGGGDYAGSRGRYGIYIDDAFLDTDSGLAIGRHATNFEVEFVEIAHVGFAGALVKTDDSGGSHMENIRFHDNYIHDTGSEGVYFGSTQGEPQHKISGLRFYNNRIVRTGTEALQLGQMGGDSEVYNNVFAWGALAWKNPFQPFQDNNTQIGAREGSTQIHHNVFVGGATNFLILFNQVRTGDSHQQGDEVEFFDNYFSHGRNIGAYFQESEGNAVTKFRFEDNIFREIRFQYDELYEGQVDHNTVFRIFNTENPIEIHNNRWSGPQSLFLAPGSNIVTSGNVNAALPPFEFVDSGFLADFDYLLLEEWAAISGLTDKPIFYSEGDWVMHLGLLYECVEVGSHTDKIPTKHPATWASRPLPPDDLRQAATSPYQGMGLLDRQGIFADGFESGNLSAWSLSTTP